MTTGTDLPPTAPAWDVVGVFDTSDRLEAAVFDLETHGFDRSAFSVLGTEAAVERRLGHRYRQVSDMADRPDAPRETFFGRASRLEAEFGPVAGLAAVGAMVVFGGGLLPVVVAAAGGAAIGAAIGGLIHQHQVARVNEQLARGGLLLWVTVRDAAQEQTAIARLRAHTAQEVHAHTPPAPHPGAPG